MQEKDSLRKIFTPKNISELLNTINVHKNALIFSGGIELMLKQNRNHMAFNNRRIVYIGQIEELSKISRKEKFIEIGANVPLAKILSIGSNLLPWVFYQALLSTGTPSIRNMATLGGIICTASAYSSLLPALFGLDAYVEIRSLYRSRWEPVSRFILTSGSTALKPGEFLSRIRLPYGEWFFESYRKIARSRTDRISNLVFCGLLKTIKNVITDIRFVFGSIGPKIYHNREFESGFIGRKLPFGEKEIQAFLLQLDQELSRITNETPSSIYKKETSLRLVRWFLQEVNTQVL